MKLAYHVVGGVTKPLLAGGFSLFLAACASTHIPVPEIINDQTYLPIPATLTAPVKVTLQPGVTWGEAVGSLYSGLQSCNANLEAIAGLVPPAPNPPKP